MKKLNFKMLLIGVCSILTVLSCKDTDGLGGPLPQINDPQVDFSWTGSQIAPAELTFTNSSGNFDRFKWDFGNGTSANVRLPGKIVFGLPGSYQVILTAFKGEKKVLVKKTIIISPDDAPLANFTYTFKDNKSAAPATLILVNNSQNAISYEWEINNSFYNVKNPANIILNNPGDCKIRLIAINGNKRSAVYEQAISVLPTNEPRSGFLLAYHPFSYTVGEEIQLVNTSLNSDSWEWTFGQNGPLPSDQEHPIIKFNSPGDYPITLVAKRGTVKAAPKTITIRINP